TPMRVGCFCAAVLFSLGAGLQGAALAAEGDVTIGALRVAPRNTATVVKIHDNNLVLNPGTAAFDVYVTHNGLQRTFTVIRPEPAPAAAPMLLMLHGRAGTAEGQANLGYLPKSVVEKRYWAVLPQYHNGSWEDDPGVNRGIDDIGLMRRIIDIMQSRYGIDTSRVYASGFSNGGFMAQRMACELSDRIAAVALVGTSITRGVYNSCAPVTPRPLMFVDGSADPIVPWAGSSTLLSVETAVSMWSARLACGLNPSTTALPNTANDGTTIDLRRYTGCSRGELRLYRVNEGGHTWPGGLQYLPATTVGKTSADLSATSEIWNFVSAYRR
ncbi:MAG TPA: hypothetical protein VLI06_16045, partial [Solimonas sp.]|nr:hypothetical protein [Solimonas sp.]